MASDMYTGFDWFCDREYPDRMPEMRCLWEAVYDLPYLRQHTTDLTGPSNFPTSMLRQDVKSTIQRLLIVDEKMIDWYTALPSEWFPHSLAHLTAMPDDEQRAEVWPGMIHVYHSLGKAGFLNTFRMLRIVLHKCILKCLDRLEALPLSPAERSPSAGSARSVNSAEQATIFKVPLDQRGSSVFTLSCIVNEICACVPYFLGLRPAPSSNFDLSDLRTELSDVQGPHDYQPERIRRSPWPMDREAERLEDRDQRAAEIGGAYAMIWPLYFALQVREASNIIPEKQRSWIRGRMRVIRYRYGLEQAMLLSESVT